MKLKAFFVLLTVAMLALSACGATEEPPAAAEPTQAVQPTQPSAGEPTEAVEAEAVELRMMWYDDGNEGEVMRD
ncbi:MAG: hypothetical protein JXM73_23720, partial [Anaerolineae bacterium]|nr:hypothetical protein [Anaerolineae bacterium]